MNTNIFSRLLFFSLALILVTFSGNNVFAKEKESPVELTQAEYNILINKVGLTETEAHELPVEVARELIKNGAVKVASGYTIKRFYEPEKNEKNDGTVSVMGTIPSSDLKLGGIAYKVTSDRSGYNKYYFYGNFTWLTSPAWELTDKMTIGFPSSAGFFLPTSNGKVVQHQHRYSFDVDKNGTWVDYPIQYTPSDWSASAGVAGEYDLIAGEGLHKGYIGQYVYIRNTLHGDMNIKIEYGHQWLGGEVGVSVYPAGLGITPSINTDTASYALTLSY